MEKKIENTKSNLAHIFSKWGEPLFLLKKKKENVKFNLAHITHEKSKDT
jgi:hypothetical protein